MQTEQCHWRAFEWGERVDQAFGRLPPVFRTTREADKDPVPDVAKRHGVSQQTIYTWRERFGGLKTDEVRRLRT